MQISELISSLQILQEIHGDLIVMDTDNYPIEEVAVDVDSVLQDELTIVLYSEGDEH